ncbi:MAG: sigma-70 family RNA polymerase sigma factor [Candidatus Aminicenantes bacterium]|nr:sigma-70 family RNA polymerase sigma factor [Candidatus Aminicenantes bacterium]
MAYNLMDSIDSKEKEFEVLITNFAQFIRIHIYKYNLNRHGLDPEDILQDVKIRIWKLIRDERIISNYASYIKKIVNSSVIDQLRKCRREEGFFQNEKRMHLAEKDLVYSKDAFRRNNLEEIVGKAVELLIDSRRQVIKLYLLNLNINEIAGYLNWSQHKTRNLLYRGLADLKDLIKDTDATHEVKK